MNKHKTTRALQPKITKILMQTTADNIYIYNNNGTAAKNNKNTNMNNSRHTHTYIYKELLTGKDCCI